MRLAAIAAVLAVLTAAPAPRGDIDVQKATPLITVTEIEPCLPFWNALGFVTTVTVPEEGPMAFAMLHHGAIELMYQTQSSIDADLGESGAPAGLGAELASGTMTLFAEVDDLDEALKATAGVEVLVPRRQTFYGMDEVFVRAPCGTLVGLAAKTATEEQDQAE